MGHNSYGVSKPFSKESEPLAERRIKSHPILSVPAREKIGFYWGKQRLEALRGEVISSALLANGIRLFGHHAKNQAAQGIFCANGQCAQCTVLADGVPVKACMTKIQEKMVVESVEGLPQLPPVEGGFRFSRTREAATEVLIVGGGPAGLSAAIQLGQRGIKTLVVDDKDRLGGKLVLQTHKFFGSIEDCHAGTRGTQIAALLAQEVRWHKSIKVWLNSTALYVFSDKKVGIVTDGRRYRIVKPKVVVIAAGAREKSLAFPGNTLPGVYGAGAFQTLVNRDLIKPAERVFIVGGGNVGLIAAYHALQAGISVVGLVEALDQCGGYKVHADKIRRLGVPIYTSQTILAAGGDEHVESVTVGRLGDNFKAIPGTEQTFACDTVLIAVGLSPVDEFFHQAQEAGFKVFAAGDAKEIAEASSAMFSGQIAGLEVARELDREEAAIPSEWRQKAERLKSPPGAVAAPESEAFSQTGIIPVINCSQEIPCNPCATVCPQEVIAIPGDPLLGQPKVVKDACIGCGRCLFICPGLAISLVDYRKDRANPIVSLAYEVYNYEYRKGDKIRLTDCEGNTLPEAEVISATLPKASSKTQIIKVRLPAEIAQEAAGFRIQDPELTRPQAEVSLAGAPDEAVICRCEQVRAGEIRDLIRRGVRDLNQIKAVTRAGMGACGAKTCQSLILQLFREEGVTSEEITPLTIRPVFVEAALGVLSNLYRPAAKR